MRIPTWIVVTTIPVCIVVWIIKVWKFDMLAEKRAAIVNAEHEKTDIRALHEGWKRGDRILEDLVANGAPSCLLAMRKLSDQNIPERDRAEMYPAQTLRSYELFHEAMKLHEDGNSDGECEHQRARESRVHLESSM